MARPENAGLARRLAGHTLHAASGRVVGLALWLVLTPPLYSTLGAEGFAVWSLFYALTSYLGALDFGLALGTARHVSAARARGADADAGAYATVSVLGYLALGIAWFALLPVVRDPVLDFLHVAGAVRPWADFAFTAGAAVFVLAGVANTLMSVLQGCERFDLGNLVAVSGSLVQGAGIALALLRGWGLPGVVCATGAGWGAAALVGYVALRRAAPGVRFASPRAAAGFVRESLRFGAPLQLASVLGAFHQQLDKLLLARFVGLAAVAPYELGLRMATALSTFPQLLMIALLPAATRMHGRGDAAGLAELYARANRYILLAASGVAAAALASAPRVFEAWLGHTDAPAALALRCLMLASWAGLGAGMATVTARAIGRTDLEARFTALALLVHLGLGMWLVRTRGLEGVLIAIAHANAIAMVWFLAELARTLGRPRWRAALEPLGWPALALIAGTVAGQALDRALPHALGAAGWPAALLVGALATAVAGGTLMLRYVPPGELRALLGKARS